MQTPTMFPHVLSATASSSLSAAYADRARADAVLCRLPTFDDAVAYLEGRAVFVQPARPDALRALVRQAQSAPHPVWAHLLMVAYRSFLTNLASGASDPDDTVERQGRVAACFLEAVSQVSMRVPSITLELHRVTTELFVAEELRESMWREVTLAGDAAQFAAPDAMPAIELRCDVADTSEDGVSDEELLATLRERGGLHDLVATIHGDATTKVQQRAYSKLAKRRARLARSLRDSRWTA